MCVTTWLDVEVNFTTNSVHENILNQVVECDK